MSRGGSSSRKLPARTSSTSWHSAGEALWTDMARGRLLSAAIATIFVPLPRRVGPTAKPPFLHSRRLHPQTPRPGSVCPAHAGAGQEASAPPPAFRCESTAGTCDGRFGTEDISQATHATALLYPAPRAHHLAPNACHAMGARGYPPDALREAPVPLLPTVHRSTPSVLPSALAETHRAPTECHQFNDQMFMRLVLAQP